MRKLKFRAWDKEKKKWIGKPFSIIGEVTVFDMIKGYSIKDFNNIEVMQYTGSLDKNKREIYENDIVKSTTQYKIIKCGVVKFEEYEDAEGYCVFNHLGWVVTRGSDSTTLLDTYPTEVIGNIYENGDLLK
ncbi:MAG TPA: hypothetical protein ENH82_17210 [bacterium]|nr:hypothetical protein [bacterium]